MKLTSILFVFTALFIFIASSMIAVPSGKTIQFTKSNMGKVTFSGQLHASKGLNCNSCHTKIFKMKKGSAKIKFAHHNAGKKYCFSCHNGSKAFKPTNNCGRCHKK